MTAKLYSQDRETCASVFIDPAGHPLGPPIEDPGCVMFGTSLAVGDAFVALPADLSAPLSVWRADAPRENRSLGDLPQPCWTCVAGAWWRGDEIVFLAASRDELGPALFRYRVGPQVSSRTAVLRLESPDSDNTVLVSSRDARGGVLLSQSLTRPGGVWVQLLDDDGNLRGPRAYQPVLDLNFPVRPAVRGEVHAFWTSEPAAGPRGHLVFASTGTTAVTVGPILEATAFALAPTPSGYDLLATEGIFELDPAGALVRRRDEDFSLSRFGAGPAGIVAAQLAQDENPLPRLLVRDQVVFEASTAPGSIVFADISGSSRGAVIAWSEPSRSGPNPPGTYRLVLQRVSPQGELAPPVSLPDLAPMRWLAATPDGEWVGLAGGLLRVGLDGQTERLPDINLQGPMVTLGARTFGIEFFRGLVELRPGGATLILPGANLLLAAPDATGARTLVGSFTRTENGLELDLRLLGSTSLLGAPITLGRVDSDLRSWTCGSGCWEFGTPSSPTRWRVVLDGNQLRGTRLDDAQRPVYAGAGDACRSVLVEREDRGFLLAGPGDPRPILAEWVSIARVGPDRFWLLSKVPRRGFSVMSVEP